MMVPLPERSGKASAMKKTESTDKRIIKTKKNLKQTLLQMMDAKPFEKIGVTELCREACTSRITFYTYYQDKYDLLYEIYSDMQSAMEEEFQQLQAENNQDDDSRQAYHNLGTAVIHMYSRSTHFFRHMNPLESPEIMKSIYDFAVKHFSDFRTQYGEQVSCRYDPDQLSAFVILGFWGFATYGKQKKISEEQRQKDALQLFDDILSGLAVCSPSPSGTYRS